MAPRLLAASVALLVRRLRFAPASGREAPSRSGPGGRLPPDAVKRLKSGDPAQIRSALGDVRVAAKAGAPAVPAIVELLRKGLPPDLTQAALDALCDAESEGGSEVLAWFARDRSIATRRIAVQGLARTKGPAAVKALRLGLTDPDPAVRGLAATGLGALKAKDTVAELFVALDHKIPEAAASIGQLCAGAECERLAGKLGSVPFDVVTSGLDEALFRPPSDVSDDVKVGIVGRVRELGTGEANRFLRSVQAKWPKTWSVRVKQAIDQAVMATVASPGAPAGAPQ